MKFKKSTPQDKSVRQRPVVQNARTPVFSYHANRSNDTGTANAQAATVPRNSHSRKQPLSFWLILIAIVFLGLASLIVWRSTPAISLVGSQAATLHPESEYAAFAAGWINKNPYNRLKPFMNKQSLVNDMQAEYPEIQDAVITTPVLGSINMSLTLAPPLLILSSNTAAFVITDQGRAAERMEDAPDALVAILPLIQDESGLSITKGQQILTRSSSRFIAEIYAQLQAQELLVERYSLPVSSSELQIQLVGKPYIIRFNMQANARQQVGTLVAVTEQLSSKREEPKEYIDVRVEERAYYR